MKKLYIVFFFVFIFIYGGKALAQKPLVSAQKRLELNNIATQADENFKAVRKKALDQAKSRGWLISRRTPNGGTVVLQGLNSLGFPVYLQTHNNVVAAATSGVNQVQPGGALGLNLSGSSTFLNNKIAVWDGGWVLRTHQEFTGKSINLKDTSTTIDHATRVAGTIMARGVYAPAKGMAFNANTLLSYDFENDVAEMTRAAPDLLISNHSYGEVAGWNYNSTAGRWEWSGLPGDSVDYNFGFYGTRTRDWDKIAYNAPYYLIVESAGNSRSSNGPAVGETYYGYSSRTNQTFVNKGARPAGISNNNGYDIISVTANAKNILTVGAVNPLPSGPSSSSSITIADFSGWGPTDDGRIKPDIVADGVNILSSSSSGPTAYNTQSGTSFSAPTVTGSLYLLQEYYAQRNSGNFMKAATLKGLACHTAYDAGRPGPDYVFGWGLLYVPTAAQAITENGIKSRINENNLAQGQTQTFNVTASGNGALMATISWTDLQGLPSADGVVNNRTPKLVNDLDIRVSDGSTTYRPWVLNPETPNAAATTGDNIRDNIEQVYIANATPGKSYTITVTHKGTLQGGAQAYSLIVTGIGGAPYCASAPLSTADSRIDNVSFANINNTPAPGCKAFSDYTTITARLERGKTYPLSVALGTCGANFSKAVKVFIDWDGNGIFETNELVATSGTFAGNGIFTSNITVPTTVLPGNFSLMRVVLAETNDPATIAACGSYAKGETQDYRVQFLQTNTDAGVTAIVNPSATGSCNGTTQLTVKLKNFGAAAITNVPVIITVKAPDNTVTTFTETYTASLKPLAEDDFTFSNTFNAIPGANYTITATTNLAGDVIATNNQVSANVLIFTPAAPINPAASFCVNNNQYALTGTGDGTLYWYKQPNDALPFAYGSSVVTTQAPTNQTYYVGLNDFSGTVGPATKNAFSGGGYNQFTPEVFVYAATPLVLQSARLYVGNPGNITFNVTNASGQIVSSTTINATATRSNPQPGAQVDDPADQGKVYNLNLTLPAAGKYTITTVYDSTATLYRNNAGVSGYPFKLGNIFSITGNSATGTDTTEYKKFYYYFYDLKVKSLGCASISRVAVTLSKPVVSQTNGTTLSSSITTGNQWYYGNQPIEGATGQTYQPQQSGNYKVRVAMPSGCVEESESFKFALKAINPGKNAIGLVTFPSPANKYLNVVFVAKAAEQGTISLINSGGKTVYSTSQAVAAGDFSISINTTYLAPGTYVLKVLLGQNVYSNKVLIVR